MIYESAYFSLIIQFLTGIIDVYGLSIELPKNKIILRELLKLELFVQTIEFIFYSWMVNNINNYSNITIFRYFDWIITTPTMLLTLMTYLDNKATSLQEYINNNKHLVIKVITLNLIMLVFGMLGELKYLNNNYAVLFGFIPFIYYYKLIYESHINNNINKYQKFMFYFFAFVWALYGIAALLPYNEKNTFYNILDLFAKNFTGIFLVYIIYQNRIKSNT